MKEELKVTTEWDKTFPLSDKVNYKKQQKNLDLLMYNIINQLI